MPNKPITITAFNPTFSAPGQFQSTVPPNGPALSLFGQPAYPDPTLENSTALDNPTNSQIRNWTPGKPVHTNINLAAVTTNVLGLAALSYGSITGIPEIGQIGQTLIEGVNDTLSGTYAALPFDKLRSPVGVLYPDFRSRISIDKEGKAGSELISYAASRRLNGFSAGLRGSVVAAEMAAASVLPVGPYSIINLDAGGQRGYGWGQHDNPYAVRKDFTMRSHVAKRVTVAMQPNGQRLVSFQPTINPLEMATPFRGDRVNVIDFGKRTLREAYLWNPGRLDVSKALGMDLNPLGLTQDFIKFFFTGPKLNAGNMLDTDDIIVFRATIDSLSDSFQPNWTPQTMIGRADPNYIYNGYGRTLACNFSIYATDRDEMQPIYRKLNALAGYTAPTYNPESVAMEGPWMRITIGDLFNQQPAILTSLSYTFDTEAPWEINVERDPNMMQAPMKIDVSMQFNLITDSLPQKGGRFYSLAKRYANGAPIPGSDNWLSDAKGNFDFADELKRFQAREKTQRSKVKGARGSGNKNKTGESFVELWKTA